MYVEVNNHATKGGVASWPQLLRKQEETAYTYLYAHDVHTFIHVFYIKIKLTF